MMPRHYLLMLLLAATMLMIRHDAYAADLIHDAILFSCRRRLMPCRHFLLIFRCFHAFFRHDAAAADISHAS